MYVCMETNEMIIKMALLWFYHSLQTQESESNLLSSVKNKLFTVILLLYLLVYVCVNFAVSFNAHFKWKDMLSAAYSSHFELHFTGAL